MGVRVPLLARLASLKTSGHATNVVNHAQTSFRSQYHVLSQNHQQLHPHPRPSTVVASFASLQVRSISYEQKAKDLNQQGVDEALSEFDTAVAEDKEKQQRAPWHRQGVDEAPVRKQRSAGAMTKGMPRLGAYLEI